MNEDHNKHFNFSKTDNATFKRFTIEVVNVCSVNACAHMSVHVFKLSKPNVTQLNSTQLKQLKSNFVGLDSVVTWNPPHPGPNFSVTSRPARELKFGTDTH